jgi:hypothetical protein
MPPMIGRRLSIAEWLSYVASYQFGAVAPSRLVLHHTFVPTVDQWAGLRSMQGMQRYYGGKGWTAAPHVYAAPDGIWLFTPMKDVGIHAGTGNSGVINGKFWYSIGLEMVGNYDGVRPSGAVWENAKAVMGGISKRLGIAPRQLISFHRDYTNQKSCPGWAVTKDWVFGEVDAWLANRTPPPPPPPGPIGTPTPDTEALIEALMDESYKRRGEGYNSDWAFHQYAVQNGLGFPIGRSAQLQDGGKSYAYQTGAMSAAFRNCSAAASRPAAWGVHCSKRPTALVALPSTPIGPSTSLRSPASLARPSAKAQPPPSTARSTHTRCLRSTHFITVCPIGAIFAA